MTRLFARAAKAIGLAMALSGASARAAFGQPADAPTGAANAAGLEKFDEGRRELEAGHFEAALAAFDASNKLIASPNSLLYMARCYKGLGKIASAFTTYRLAARQAQDRLVATADKRYSATRDAAAREAAEIEARVPKLAVMVPSDAAADVSVKVNGIEVPRATWATAIDTDAGHIVVDATGRRLRPFHAEVDLGEGATERVDVVFARVPTARVRLRLVSRPLGLAVRVAGSPVEPGEVEPERELDPGPCVVEATAPGYRDFTWRADLADGQDADVDVALVADAPAHERRGTPRWLLYSAGGASLVSTGIASILALHAKSVSDREQAKNPYTRDADARTTIRSESTAANVLFVTGALFGVGAGVLLFTTEWRGAAQTQKIGVGPLGPYPSVSATGRF
jgi:hypothetical protein